MASFSFRALSLAALVALSGTAASQVVISEVMINPDPGSDLGKQWIEVTNVSNSSVSMADWTLFVSTRKTLGTTEPGTYYWPFPKTGPGSLIPAGGRILIRWLQTGTNGPVVNPAHDQVFTGITVYDFLFGLFHYNTTKTPPESDMVLPTTGGAIGLIRSQDAKEVLLPGFWADFVQYGDSGFKTPVTSGFPPVSLPVQAGIWAQDSFVPIPSTTTEWPLGESLAYSYTGNSHLNYWRDTSPTPGDVNSKGAQINTFGKGCACIKNGKVMLMSVPIPAILNSQEFKLMLTEGIPNSPAIVFLSTGFTTSSQTYLDCDINLANLLISLPPIVTDANGMGITSLPIPQNPVLIGSSLAAQYFLASTKTFNGLYCSSNAVSFSIGL